MTARPGGLREGPRRKVSHYSYFSGKLPPAPTVMVTKISQKKKKKKKRTLRLGREVERDDYLKFPYWILASSNSYDSRRIFR